MRIVIAFGGNALIREDERGTWTEQTAHAIEAAKAIARVARAHEVVLTHGNGPQVGALALQQAGGEPDAPALPFDVLDAMTQGEIGYLLQQALERGRPLAADRHDPDARAGRPRGPGAHRGPDEADRPVLRRADGAAAGRASAAGRSRRTRAAAGGG